MKRAPICQPSAVSCQLPTIDEIIRGETPALGRAITLFERDAPSSGELLKQVKAKTGQAFRVGFTGPPGAGKSSLLREVIRRLRTGGERAALVASDPVSPLTGGALLGDRCRLSSLSQDPGVFIRSVAHRSVTGGHQSGLAPAVWLAADVLDAAGFPWVFLETVGMGQADSHALEGANLKVFVHSPESGDYIQMLKAGLVETADLHAVTKCDRPGSRAWAEELAETLSAGVGEASQPVKVFPLSSATGEGVDALVGELKACRLRAHGRQGTESRGGEKA